LSGSVPVNEIRERRGENFLKKRDEARKEIS
jgi:hypothetical protein